MLLRQLFDSETSTYTYLLADEVTKEALLIDTVFEKHLRDLALLRELDLSLKYTVETHVHADHVTGAWLMKRAVGSSIVVGAKSGAEGADVYLEHLGSIRVGSVELEARATPGHTGGCLTYVSADHSCAFTGDALLIRGAGRTDFQEGSPETLFESVRGQILSLPGECRLYPGHDYAGRTMTTVAEERAHNPRLGDGTRLVDFVGYMRNLGLPHPKKMDAAVPANLRCGKPEEGDSVPSVPDWGPVVRTFAGVLEISPEWVREHQAEVCLLDVREDAEYSAGPIPHIAGSLGIPLSQLAERTKEVPDDKIVVAVCPAGARGARAAQLLEKSGCPRVANLAGGVFAWEAMGFPVGRGPL